MRTSDRKAPGADLIGSFKLGRQSASCLTRKIKEDVGIPASDLGETTFRVLIRGPDDPDVFLHRYSRPILRGISLNLAYDALGVLWRGQPRNALLSASSRL